MSHDKLPASVNPIPGLSRKLRLGVSLLTIIFLLATSANAQTPFPTNNDPARQIRFKTPAEADARRDLLVRFIWKDGLPATVPSATLDVQLPQQAISIDPANIERVDQLDIDVSSWGFHCYVYLLHPTNKSNANRFVIVHQGHAGTLESGVGTTADHLLRNGFTVAIMEMPLYGWNTDKDAEIPGRGLLKFHDHGQIIYKTAENDDGQGFRLFLEPVVQTVNYIVANSPQLKDIGMVGLSGGGWTTSMAAAIDPRIKLSVPIAGSAPLYHRNIDASSVGDPEQYFLPLYREDIGADGTGGGIATWIEIYALGGYGEGRRQIQATNEFDSCCFPGKFADKYKNIVAKCVVSLGAGKWEHFLDSTHNAHLISSHAIANVINPIFGIAEPVAPPSGLPIVDDFNNQEEAFPGGWIADPRNGGGYSAQEKNGVVEIRGKRQASIVRSVPFNPKRNRPVTITMKLASMSRDNLGGVFITDEIGPRPHQLGVVFNAGTGDVAVKADNGDGFDPLSDRVNLGKLDGYDGGPATITFTFDDDGYSVDIDAGNDNQFNSGNKKWSSVPGGFDPDNLGDHVHLFIQGSDMDGGEPAVIAVEAIEVRSK